MFLIFLLHQLDSNIYIFPFVEIFHHRIISIPKPTQFSKSYLFGSRHVHSLTAELFYLLHS